MFRKPSQHAQIEHIWSQDPAIDRDHPAFDFDKFVETGDRKHLPLKNGGQPATFMLRRLTGDAREYADSIARKYADVDPWHWIYELCAVGLQKVEATFEDGGSVDLARFIEHDRANRIQRLSSEGMALLFAAGATDEFPSGSQALIYELGARVQRETYGDPLSRRGSG